MAQKYQDFYTVMGNDSVDTCPQCGTGSVESESVSDDHFQCQNCYTLMGKLPGDGVCAQCNGGPVRGESVYSDEFECSDCYETLSKAPTDGVCPECGGGPVRSS